MPKVYNKRHKDVPTDAVYVGRPTKWGNPFSHLPSTIAKHKVSSREAAVRAYQAYLLGSPALFADLHELRGKDLVCWCAPHACHADILMKLANEET